MSLNCLLWRDGRTGRHEGFKGIFLEFVGEL